MKPITQVRRERLRELIAEEGTQAAVAVRIGKDKNHIHQWLLPTDAKGARNIGSRSARLIEVSFAKPNGWMDTDPDAFSNEVAQDYRHSQSARPTASILAEAVKVMAIDEGVNGPYPPLKHAELLLELCDRLAAGEDQLLLIAQATKQRHTGGRHATIARKAGAG